MVAAAVVVVLPVVAMVPVTVVVAVTAAATSVAVRARRTPASLVKILATARQHQVNRVRRKPHAIATIPNRRASAKIPNRHVTAKNPNRHVTVTSNSTRIRAVHALKQEASRAMTSTTSNPPATPRQDFRRPASRQAATAATSAADAPVAVRVAVVAGATGLVGQAVLARSLADKSCAAVQAVGPRAQAFQACSPGITYVDSYFFNS